MGRAFVGLLLAGAVGCGGSGGSPSSGTSRGTPGATFTVQVIGDTPYFDVSSGTTLMLPLGGRVTAAGGLDCGIVVGIASTRCSVEYPWGDSGGPTTVTATATPDAATGYAYFAFAGACSGDGPCSITGNADALLAVRFARSRVELRSHPNWSDPALHGSKYLDAQAGVPGAWPCSTCHGATLDGQGIALSCNACHAGAGFPNWRNDCGFCHRYPPVTGAHRVHFQPFGPSTGGVYGDTRVLQDLLPAMAFTAAPTGYAFGCGNCHPVDAARHMDGHVDVDLSPSGAPAGSLKARNSPAAVYAADGTCSGVACHSSGQAAPDYRTTPGWAAGTSLACDGCHGMPPRYPSGSAGSATANTHLVPRSTTYMGTDYTGAYGHFAWHNRTRALYTQYVSGQHGATDSLTGNEVADGTFGAAPMTCQACHYETVDPAATGPSGFWWLNTTGNYQADGQNYAAFDCTRSGCHDGQPTRAPAGDGGVLPWRHVNGRRDVIFDPRTATTTYRAPAAPAAPVFPYWVTVSEFKDANHLPPGSTLSPWPPPPDGTAAAGTLSFELSGAAYDPATKTCASVSCHLAQTSARWGGTAAGTMSTCFDCHTIH
jgi:predicted CxxxxCH...CXXCH cytochrome family protein